MTVKDQSPDRAAGEIGDRSEPTIAARLGAYLAAPTPPATHLIERARFALLDSVGAMIGATGTVAGARMLEFTRLRGALGTTSTVGLTERRRAEDSALANATLAHMLEFDDGHRPSDNHLGCVVVPTAVVMAEEAHASLRQCLEAIIVGYDVMGRAGEATLLPRNESPFHGTGTTGVFGAAAVAAQLLDLDADATAQALAIAGTSAAGLRESMNTGPDCKPLHAGRAASNGISAAYLAQLGYTGPLTIFEGTHGFCTAMVSQPRPQLLLDELGTRRSLLEAGFKVHSTCGILFTVLDGILECRAEHDLAVRRPATIRIGVPSLIVDDPPFKRTRPQTVGQARFSIPYAVAVAVVDGEVSLRQMTPERLSDPAVAELEARVRIEYDGEVEAIYQATKDDAFFYYPSSIDLEIDGRTHRTIHTNPRGYDPTLPLTEDEIVAKFHSTVTGRIPGEVAAQLVELIVSGHLDKDISQITELLQGVR